MPQPVYQRRQTARQSCEDSCPGALAPLLHGGDERSVICFERDKRPKQCARAERLNIATKDSGEERAGNRIDDLVAEVAAHECGDTFVGIVPTMQQCRLTQLLCE